jgi:hypothetical protein
MQFCHFFVTNSQNYKIVTFKETLFQTILKASFPLWSSATTDDLSS